MIRILTLNLWGGTLFAPLLELIRRESERVDVFCFQEVFSSSSRTESRGRRMNLLEELARAIPDFAHVFAPTISHRDHLGPVDFDVAFGNATFVRNSISYTSQTVQLYEGMDPAGPGNHPRIMLAVSLEQPNVCVGNIHGLWVPTGKNDTPDRIEQSRRLLDFVSRQSKPVILAGDFNLRPETQSVAMLAQKLSNLIAIHGIQNTRTKYYADAEKYQDFIADYVFVSPELQVTNFEVLPDAVSDHRALAVEVS